MKTSKLLVLTIVGLIFSIVSVMGDQEGFTFINQLPTTAKTYIHKYFSNSDIAYANMKDKIIKTTYEMSKNNNYDLEFTYDGMMTDFDY